MSVATRRLTATPSPRAARPPVAPALLTPPPAAPPLLAPLPAAQLPVAFPPGGLVVRPAGRTDLAPLQFFFDALLRKDYFLKRGQLADILTGGHHRVYVAEIDAVLVGAAITTRDTRLVNVLVHPAYRGLGIGAALVRSSGATEVRVKLDGSAGNPRRFYEKLGFVTTQRFNGKGNIELLWRRDAAPAAGRHRPHGNGRTPRPAASTRPAPPPQRNRRCLP